MQYVSIDIETTGLDPDTCDVLEVAAVIDNDPSADIVDLPVFRYRVVKDSYKGEPYAFSMHHKLLRALADNANLAYWEDQPADNRYGLGDYFSVTFQGWLARHKVSPNDFVAAGKNFANFDARFLRPLLRVNRQVRWHHRILDPASMFVRRTDTHLPDTEECCRRAGINPDDIPGEVHTAIHDARVVVALVRKGLIL